MTGPDGDSARPATEVFREWADGTVRRLPLYRRLCEGAATDPDVAHRLSLSPDPSQRVPTLLLAAVHDVLLAGDHDPHAVALRRWYSSVTPTPRPIGRGAEDPWPHFRELALHHPGVADRIRTGATQTNEVGRCATLIPAMVGVGDAGQPLGLVEVGSSAGLNLLLDHYGYRYRRRSGTGQPDEVVVNGDSPLVLDCALRGDRAPVLSSEPPVISSRVGIDRSPVDVGDPAQARWLVACQWPDQPERVHRARTAIAMAHGRRPRIRTGDAVDSVAHEVLAVADDALAVVISTWVLSYLSEQRQQAFVGALDAVGDRRDLSLILAEQPEMVPGLVTVGAVPPRPDGRPDGPATALVRVDWRGGRRTAARLADQHPHGTWLEWLAEN